MEPVTVIIVKLHIVQRNKKNDYTNKLLQQVLSNNSLSYKIFL